MNCSFASARLPQHFSGSFAFIASCRIAFWGISTVQPGFGATFRAAKRLPLSMTV